MKRVRQVHRSRARRRDLLAVLWSGMVSLAMPSAGMAQAAGGEVSGSPWLWRWSPIAPSGDLGLPRPQGAPGVHLLDLPAPRVGLAWSAGNPAGLHDDVAGTWTQLALSSGGATGTYRRPLEPASVASLGASLSAWRRIGDRVSALGRVAVVRDALGAGTPSAFVSPYGATPFTPADTNRPALNRPSVTIEGGEAIAFGAWRLGVAAGVRMHENNSSRSTAALVGRGSSAGVTVGAVRRLAGDLRLGVHARRMRGSETVNLIANPRTVRVYALDGYVSVDAGDYSPGLPPFFRRADREGWSAGGELSGRARGATWAAWGRWASNDERQRFAIANGVPTDRWRASGWAAGGAAQRVVWGTLATARAEWVAERGDAERATTEGGGYVADASRLVALADVRWAPEGSPWRAGGVMSIGRDWQAVDDRTARMTSDVVGWGASGAVEVGRRVSERLTLVTGYGASGYTPYAGVPSPADRGRAYRTLVAPALEVAAASARSSRVMAATHWRIGGRDVVAGGWTSSLRPLRRPPPEIPLPRGRRSAWGVTLSVEKGGS